MLSGSHFISLGIRVLSQLRVELFGGTVTTKIRASPVAFGMGDVQQTSEIQSNSSLRSLANAPLVGTCFQKNEHLPFR